MRYSGNDAATLLVGPGLEDTQRRILNVPRPALILLIWSETSYASFAKSNPILVACVASLVHLLLHMQRRRMRKTAIHQRRACLPVLRVPRQNSTNTGDNTSKKEPSLVASSDACATGAPIEGLPPLAARIEQESRDIPTMDGTHLAGNDDEKDLRTFSGITRCCLSFWPGVSLLLPASSNTGGSSHA